MVKVKTKIIEERDCRIEGDTQIRNPSIRNARLPGQRS
jgi:hypothetical protein